MEKLANVRAARPFKKHGRLPLICLATIGTVLFLQFYYLPSQLPWATPSQVRLSRYQLDILEEGLQKCMRDQSPVEEYASPTPPFRSNPRWTPERGQKGSVLIKNATLFDGTTFLEAPVDILFRRGAIVSVAAASAASDDLHDTDVVEAAGKYVSPGLVDMHSHHLIMPWPSLPVTDDANEVNAETGPLTPMVRSLDGIKAYDKTAVLIASGGITSSLILPGSANIMGGEAYPVKNILRSGPTGEEVVEELLLEYGIPEDNKRRYMKMACGENPERVYDHTRMGNAWKLREQMAKGKDLLARQDAWCLSAAAAKESGDAKAISALVQASETKKGGYPEELKLDSTVAMMRGKVNVNIHCYEQQDFEDMLRHSDEFGFPINAFHHAIEAWRVPELIKTKGHNITVATFQDFALYKHEAYDASLHAGKTLAEHGVPVAYKSDHSEEDLNAKYLLFQVAGAHSFGLDADLALQAVTSVPARSIEQDHRIGFVKPGYDADIVVWDSHPLSIGATPLQVYIDGKATLEEAKVKESLALKASASAAERPKPKARPEIRPEERIEFCDRVQGSGARLTITGIARSYTDMAGLKATSDAQQNLTMVLESGKVSCFGNWEDCLQQAETSTVVKLENGYVLPGLTAVTGGMGLLEISDEDSTGDGSISKYSDLFDPQSVIYAKYGVHLEGKGFERASLGGVTRAISPPMSYGTMLRGVSTGIRVTGNKTILDGGIFQDDVALHFVIGQEAKGDGSPTISSEIGKLRKMLADSESKDSIYGKAASGAIPVAVHVFNKHDILQLVKLKREHKKVKLVLIGGHEAHAVAKELAEADIPLIFTAHRGAADQWEKKGILPGPPLSRSSASVLAENNVTFAISVAGNDAPMGESTLHNLALEASWAAKYAGLSEQQAVDLVSKNVESILGLEGTKDFVVYEGNPLEFGASVVMTVDSKEGKITECWPTAV